MNRALVEVAVAALAALLWLGPAERALGQCCGDCDGNGHVDIGELVTAVNRALSDCMDDGICQMDTCPAQLAECRDDLADCEAQAGGRRLPASGQTTAYGSGSDGDVRAGGALSYTDNGDGTITDNNTGLMWEKKDHSGGIHDVDNTYTWGMQGEPYIMNGSMVTEFLAALNTPPCFAGHCDWRIPNVKELQSIVDYQVVAPGPPTIGAAFNNAAGCTGCTDVRLASCSCAKAASHWSATTWATLPSNALGFDFLNGRDITDGKMYRQFVRAVRGGL